MSNHMRRSEVTRDMQANLVSGRLRGHPQALQRLIRRIPPFITIPFANPYILWPPYFDYLSHFASSTFSFTRKRIVAKFQKGQKRSGYRKQAFNS